MQPCSGACRKHTMLRSFPCSGLSGGWEGLGNARSSARGLAQMPCRNVFGCLARGDRSFGPDFLLSVTGHMHELCNSNCIPKGLDPFRPLPEPASSSHIPAMLVKFKAKGRGGGGGRLCVQRNKGTFERIDTSHKEPPLAVTQNDGE
jgi:hypothetical protein